MMPRTRQQTAFSARDRRPPTADCERMSTASRDVIIRNKLGLHARPAMQFVDLANRFQSQVRVDTCSGERVQADGKSVMQMIILAAIEGTKLRITADGGDAQAAVDMLAGLVESGFGDD